MRRLLVVGATAVIRHTKDKPTPMADWIRALHDEKANWQWQSMMRNDRANDEVNPSDSMASAARHLDQGESAASPIRHQLERQPRKV